MYVESPRSTLYGFCPSKVSRDDPETTDLFHLLVVVAETGQLLTRGGLADQPAWFIEELAWFLPKYDAHKFARNAAMVFGSDDAPKQAGSQPVAPDPRAGRQRGGK